MVGGIPNLMYSPGPGLWTLDLGPSGPELGPGPGPELDKMYQAISNQVSPENSDRIHSFSPPPTAVTEGVLLDYHNTLYFLLCSPHVLLGLLTGVD